MRQDACILHIHSRALSATRLEMYDARSFAEPAVRRLTNNEASDSSPHVLNMQIPQPT